MHAAASLIVATALDTVFAIKTPKVEVTAMSMAEHVATFLAIRALTALLPAFA